MVPYPGTQAGLVVGAATAAAAEFQIEIAAGTLWAAAVILSVVAGTLSVAAGNVVGSTRPNSVLEEQVAARFEEVQFEGIRSTVVATEWRQIQ